MKKFLALLICIILCLSMVACSEPEETPPDDFLDSRTPEYMSIGSYPQNEVTDAALKSALSELAGPLPTSLSDESWTSYKYYIELSNTTDFMWYQDVTYENELYRGVYFTSCRPFFTSNSEEHNNGYDAGAIYWFKWEPIKWRILSKEDGKAFLLCETIIDSQAYQDLYESDDYGFYVADSSGNILTDNEKKVYANNYQYSTIRKWLNETFYETAFNELEKAKILTTTVENANEASKYSCANTQDKIFLPSHKEMRNSSYGFMKYDIAVDTARRKQPTAYAISQGLYTFSTDGTDLDKVSGNGYWWLRTPSSESSDSVHRTDAYGRVTYTALAYFTRGGIVPAMWISL